MTGAGGIRLTDVSKTFAARGKIVGGVILVVRKTVERDARHVDAWPIDDTFVVGGGSGEVALVVGKAV